MNGYCGIVNVPDVIIIIIYELPNFVCTEVSTVFYACYLLTCVFGQFEALSCTTNFHLVSNCSLFNIH